MADIIFYISLSSMAVILLASLTSVFVEQFEFFPPPSSDCWQYYVFRVLFRIMFVGLLILSFTEFNSEPLFSSSFRYWVWLPTMLIGFGAAMVLTAKIGWKTAFGDKGNLTISGPYRWSRNPIYVVSIFGMVGWGLFVNSDYVSIILGAWALMYILTPFVEEPWLERTYGEDYKAYKAQTSRFFGLPK